MSLRARVTFSIDEASRTLVFRYIGDLTGDRLYAQIIDYIQTVEAPWFYDFLVDARRFEGVIQSSDTEAFGRWWADIAQGRDAGRRIAVVSGDPLIHARKGLRDTIFPHRTSGVFDTMDEAQEWLATASPEAAA
ncbi:STAS/SEC14 domain-containing protein [Asticcacaulis taihuensis]|uniref:STAS/SEC14 domain-containing protein n=1 Tax=Asticcacaulis taihuensis TaxID=260084 RepID=UPI003F7C0823